MRPLLITAICLSFVLTTAHADDSTMTVPSETWTTITHTLPDSAFSAAHESVVKHDWNAATAYIRSAAAYTSTEAQRAGSTGADALAKSASALNTLADRIKSTGSATLNELDKPFADAEHALSVHYADLATRAHDASDDMRAGHLLQKAGDSLKAAASWSGQQLDSGTSALLHEARNVGTSLSDGTSWALSKAGELTVKLGEATKALGEKM